MNSNVLAIGAGVALLYLLSRKDEDEGEEAPAFVVPPFPEVPDPEEPVAERTPPDEELRSLQSALNEFRDQINAVAADPTVAILSMPEIYAGDGCSKPGRLDEDGYWGPCTHGAVLAFDNIVRAYGYAGTTYTIEDLAVEIQTMIGIVYSVIDSMEDDPFFALELTEVAYALSEQGGLV
jgi:hypothetical protein